jgi:hypothetical protein
MQGVNRVDSWSQFVNLVQDARSRNQTLGAPERTPAAAGPAKGSRTAAAAEGTRRTIAPQAAAIPAAQDLTNMKTKTLGGLFDTYA